MFIQVVKGKTKDAAGVKALGETWQAELKPGAKGWLGTTSGVAKDGTFIVVIRFESQEDAQANSDRPEQGAFFQEILKLLDGAPTFYNCNDVTTFMGGGSDDAGFVQLMIYKPSDLDKAKELNKKFENMDMSGRPDIIGGTSAVSSDGTVIDTNYFTSEAEARAGEKGEMPAEMQEMMKEYGEVVGNVEYVDISDPWLYSA
jgi:hypothetical protein